MARMKREEFRQLLQKQPLLLDGAMGTMLHGRGIPIDECFDVLNIKQPALVAEIHRSYIDVGADIIETNSFGANRYKLAHHGLEQEVSRVNQAAVDVARRVIGGSFKPVLLAGSVGPLGVRLAPLGRVSVEEARAAFAEQMRGLLTAVSGGVDLLIIETMSNVREVETAVAAARSLDLTIPIVTNMTFTRDDRTLLGNTPDDVAARLAALDVDVIGVNCSGGPSQVLRLITAMRQVAPDMLLAAVPNAGWPQHTEGGRVLYPATPDYFADYTRAFVAAGVRLIGGCCGTSAAHIAAMRQALDTPIPNRILLPRVEMVDRLKKGTAVADPPTQLAHDLARKRFVVTVEMSPPRGIATQRLLEGAHMLKEAGVTHLNIADSPLARMRMSAWAAAYLVQRDVELETVLHFPTRGRNLLRVQGDLLAAYALGIRNLFVVMGDPTRIGDYPEAMDSYDIVPTGLIHLIKQQFNAGVDKSGESIDYPTNFLVGCAVSLTPDDPAHEMKLLRKKIHSGADFALTQPIFDPLAAKGFIELYEATYQEPILPIIAGIKPLYNSRNAEFLHHEVPGVSIPTIYRERMHGAQDEQQEGVLIAQELVQAIRPFVQGLYLMPAFNRYDLVADVLDVLKE